MKKLYIISFVAAAMLLTACDKVSPIGVLVSGTGVEDRVKMSNIYFSQYRQEDLMGETEGDYTFLVGADSHVTDDLGRMEEMFQQALDHDDILMAHLGDIADTKAEYYINLDKSLKKYKKLFAEKNYEVVDLNVDGSVYDEADVLYKDKTSGDFYELDDITYPFFPVVGNHDITHNGWALWSSMFHSSFYMFDVLVEDTKEFDHFIFLDTASGTLGREQVKLIEEGKLDGLWETFGYTKRHTFVFSHTNIFRPSSLQFASTFAREETFFLLNQFARWDASIVFCGHVHKWDEQEVGGIHYLTLDSMSERNNPEPGDYLVRVHVKSDGSLSWERVHMNYTKK